jgi:hypothetical protein
MNFQDLLGPISEPLFFERYFEREVLHIEREDTAAFVKLSDSIDIEQIIHLSCHNWGEVSLAKAGAGPAHDDYTSHPPTVSIIDRAYRDGYTVVINDLQKRSLTVAELCRSVEARFFCRANVNLYRTAAGCAGLDCHYDDDDVIVIQLRGHKVWQTYQHRDRLPLGESSYHLGDIGQADRRLSMRPGDVLYMPRGTPHQAAAQASASLHLTISLNLLRWTDVLRELVLDVAEDDVWLRRAVPAEVLRENASWPSAALVDRLRAALDRRDASGAIVRAQERLLAGPARIASRRALSSIDKSIDDIDADTAVEIAPDQIWCMSGGAEGAVVRAIETRLEFPGELAPVAKFLAQNRVFTPAQMPETVPVARRIDIVRQLLDHGFLILAR